jgi:hypothetical protein
LVGTRLEIGGNWETVIESVGEIAYRRIQRFQRLLPIAGGAPNDFARSDLVAVVLFLETKT